MIPKKYHKKIRKIEINETSQDCDYEPWMAKLAPCYHEAIEAVQSYFEGTICRKSLTRFYGTKETTHLQRFIACMIWGYGTDGYGPYRVNCMLEANVEDILDQVSVESETSIVNSYNLFRRGGRNVFSWLGPSYFTKHLYFTGKAESVGLMPVILDSRVATGIANLNFHERGVTLDFLEVKGRERADWYLAYLKYINECAKEITCSNECATEVTCSPDQVELFFFNIQDYLADG